MVTIIDESAGSLAIALKWVVFKHVNETKIIVFHSNLRSTIEMKIKDEKKKIEN